MAIVFVAGPVSGLVMQPLIGARASWVLGILLLELLPRYPSGQLHLQIRQTKTLHDGWHRHLRLRHVAARVYQMVRINIYRME